MTKIAIVQQAPVFLDKQQTVEKACEIVKQVAAEGARLILFSETFIPGYPAWIWRLRPGGDGKICQETHRRLLENSVDISSDDLDPLKQAAIDHQLTIVCGLNEKDYHLSRATLYNAMVTIDQHGKIINHHRKLMPTNPERMTWGAGDARGLKVVETPVGRIGGLICWENFMPLARYALYAQGVEIYLAPTYDEGEGWIGSMQHIAREARCWVISCGSAIQGSDIPDDFPEKARLYPDPQEWINPGDSVVVAPGGNIVAGPMHQQKGVLYFDIDLEQSATAKRTLDVAGHYSRPDIFTLQVNTEQQTSLTINDNK